MIAGGHSTPAHDVVVVGDGPAGAAIGSACAALELDTVVVGRGASWTNTYGAWIDELTDLPDDVWAGRREQVIVGGDVLHRIDRAYGTIDNPALRRHLGLDDLLLEGFVTDLAAGTSEVEVRLDTGQRLRSAWIVDATGADGAAAAAWQTAYGVVVPGEVVSQVAADDAVTLMDWSWSGSAASPSFLYVVPVADGWLVEHTVLASVKPVDPLALRAELIERLPANAVGSAEADGRFESVRIPMGVPPSTGDGRVVRFGARAGMSHPATGYSVTSALNAAGRVARAIASGSDVHAAVWPTSARRARALHDYGLAALLRLDAQQTASFFRTFFALPVEQWSAYLRVATTPSAVASVMASVYRRAPWSVRRRLAGGDWRAVSRLLTR